jgi:type IV secretory pathway VirB3-like protein
LVRIGAVVGMSVAAATGIFLLIAALWWQGLIAIALAVPFFAVMRLVERTAEPPEAPPSS